MPLLVAPNINSAPKKKKLLAFSFATFEMTRGSTGKVYQLKNSIGIKMRIRLPCHTPSLSYAFPIMCLPHHMPSPSCAFPVICLPRHMPSPSCAFPIICLPPSYAFPVICLPRHMPSPSICLSCTSSLNQIDHIMTCHVIKCHHVKMKDIFITSFDVIYHDVSWHFMTCHDMTPSLPSDSERSLWAFQNWQMKREGVF